MSRQRNKPTPVDVVRAILIYAGAVLFAMAMWWLLMEASVAEAQGLPRPYDAVEAAYQDVLTLRGAGFDTSAVRYVWVQSGDPGYRAVTSFVVNSTISRSAINYPLDKAGSPIISLAGGYLVRIDLAQLAPKDSDFEEIRIAWDKIKNTRFLLPVSETTVTTKDGESETTAKVVPLFGPHVNQEHATELQLIGGPETPIVNPIVSLDEFVVSALSQIDGGLYYDFLGIRKSDKEGVTDEELFLTDRGVDAKAFFANVLDQRTAQTISSVTGKNRVVIIIEAPGRAAVNQGLIVFTYDPLDANQFDPDYDPFLNPLTFKTDGKEVIFERENGHLGFLLLDGVGNRVDEAPPDLVADHEIPRPYTRRLHPGVSCIRCHSKPDEDGWKPFPNDLRDVIGEGFAFGGDLTQKDQRFAQERFARNYLGRIDKVMRRAREDHSDAIVECVGNVQAPDGGPWQYEDVGAAVSQIFSWYHYTPITADIAIRELGYEPGENAVETLRVLLGTPIDGSEDIRLALLMAGKSLHRAQWEQVYIDASSRAALTQAAVDQVEADSENGPLPEEAGFEKEVANVLED